MSDKPQLTYKYVFNHNYNPVYANGAYGGVSPRGEIVINFYLERQPLPNAVTHEINPNGTIGRDVAIEPDDFKSSLVRFVEAGVVFNLDTARNFHGWLGERIRELEAMEQAKASVAQPAQSSPGTTH